MNQPNIFEYTPAKEPETLAMSEKETVAVTPEMVEITEDGSQWTPEQLAQIKSREQEQPAIEGEVMPPKQEGEQADIGTALATIDNPTEKVVKMFSDEKGLDPFIDEIRKRVKSEVFDVTTEKGRARIGSVARQIGSAKTKMSKMADSLTEDRKKEIKLVTSEKTRMEKEMDALRDEVLAPRDEFNAREKKRVDNLTANLSYLESREIYDPSSVIPAYFKDPTQEQIQDHLKNLDAAFNRDWQEFAEKANVAFDAAKKHFIEKLNERVKRDKDAAELERLRREQAEREQAERDKKIADDAAAAAKLEAEEKAAKEAKDAQEKADREKREIEEKAAKERKEKEEAQARADKAEADRIENHKKAIKQIQDMAVIEGAYTSTAVLSRMETAKVIYDGRDWQEFAEQANNEFLAANGHLEGLYKEAVNAEMEAKAAADKAAADAAAKAERERQAAEQKKKDDEAAKRAADVAHRKKINNAALQALMSLNGSTQFLTEDQAIAIVTAIAKGEIPNVTIAY